MSCSEGDLGSIFVLGCGVGASIVFVGHCIINFCRKPKPISGPPIIYHAQGEYSKALSDGSFTIKKGNLVDGKKDGLWTYKTIPSFKEDYEMDADVEIMIELVDGNTYDVSAHYVRGMKHGSYTAILVSEDNEYCVTKITGQYDSGYKYGVFTYYRDNLICAELTYTKPDGEFTGIYHPSSLENKNEISIPLPLQKIQNVEDNKNADQ